MRILIVTDQFPPTHFGGMAQHAWHICQYLAKHHEVLVLLPEACKGCQKNLPFEVVPKLTMWFPRIDNRRSLSVAKKFNTDVIHVCNAGLAFPSLVSRYPVLTRVVGNDFLRPWCGGGFLFRSLFYRLPGRRLRDYIKRRESKFRQKNISKQLNMCRVIVANTEWTERRLVERGAQSELVHVVCGGCDTNTFQPPEDKQAVRLQLGLAPNELVLLIASNLVRDKAIDVMLHAVSLLVKDFPTLRYIVVGSGPEEQNLKGVVSDFGLSNVVDFVGSKSQQELKSYYQSADIYVQASRVETMGRTYMEAGGCGIPVIGARVGGVPSVIEDGKNGLLVDDPEDVDEVAARISQLLADPTLRSRMGAEGVKLAREKFSWERVGNAFEKIIVECAGKNGQQREVD